MLVIMRTKYEINQNELFEHVQSEAINILTEAGFMNKLGSGVANVGKAMFNPLGALKDGVGKLKQGFSNFKQGFNDSMGGQWATMMQKMRLNKYLRMAKMTPMPQKIAMCVYLMNANQKPEDFLAQAKVNPADLGLGTTAAPAQATQAQAPAGTEAGAGAAPQAPAGTTGATTATQTPAPAGTETGAGAAPQATAGTQPEAKEQPAA